LRPFTRTSFHHQPEAQHPKSSAIHKLPADYPIYWDGPAVLLPRQRRIWHAISQNLNSAIAVISIDIDKNSFHVLGLDNRGALVLR
jgi:hypothetical protein